MSAVKRINQALDSWETAQNGDGVALFQPRPMDVIEVLKERKRILDAMEYAKNLIGAQNDRFDKAVQESNINIAWHTLNKALTEAEAA